MLSNVINMPARRVSSSVVFCYILPSKKFDVVPTSADNRTLSHTTSIQRAK